jgi:hypothetical protein
MPGEKIYFEICSPQEACEIVEGMKQNAWFDMLIINLGWIPIGEDDGGNLLMWQQTGKIYDGVFAYILHDECVRWVGSSGENCKVSCRNVNCDANWCTFEQKYLIPLNKLP